MEEIADLVLVATSGSRTEAMLKVTALEDAGYRSVLLADDAGGLHPEMSYLYRGAYRVLVPSDEEDEARTFLAELDAGEHALASDEPPGPGTDHRAVSFDGHRRGWVAVAVALVAIFLVYRMVDSAWSFGLF